MFERILVTGYSGFVGPWVLAELRRIFPEALLFGAARNPVSRDWWPAAPDHEFQLDLSDDTQIEAVVSASRPNAVVHLASLKTASLNELLAVNAVGCERLLAHLESVVPEARAVVIGSSAELGRSAERDIPLDESAPCQPVDFYGITKLAQSAIANRQALRGQDVVQLRPFNLFGPNMPDSLLAGRCVRQLQAATRAAGPVELEFGPLDARRDYLDVRDLARAIALALQDSPPRMHYNIGSGTSRSGHDLVNALIKESGVRNVTYKAHTSSDGSLVPWQTADYRRAQDILGWKPTIGWHQSIRDIWGSARGPEQLTETAA